MNSSLWLLVLGRSLVSFAVSGNELANADLDSFSLLQSSRVGHPVTPRGTSQTLLDADLAEFPELPSFGLREHPFVQFANISFPHALIEHSSAAHWAQNLCPPQGLLQWLALVGVMFLFFTLLWYLFRPAVSTPMDTRVPGLAPLDPTKERQAQHGDRGRAAVRQRQDVGQGSTCLRLPSFLRGCLPGFMRLGPRHSVAIGRNSQRRSSAGASSIDDGSTADEMVFHPEPEATGMMLDRTSGGKMEGCRVYGEMPLVPSRVVTGVSLGRLADALSSGNDDCLLRSYILEHLNGADVQLEPWFDSMAVPGTRVRRLCYRCPLPEAPEAVRGIVGVPKDSAVTALTRLCVMDDQVLLEVEIDVHDAPFAEHFVAIELLVLEPALEGGVSFRKWGAVRWRKPMPWYTGPISGLIESGIKDGARDSGNGFAKLLQANVENVEGLV